MHTGLHCVVDQMGKSMALDAVRKVREVRAGGRYDCVRVRSGRGRRGRYLEDWKKAGEGEGRCWGWGITRGIRGGGQEEAVGGFLEMRRDRG